MEKKENKSKTQSQLTHTVRQGAIAANNWLRQSQTGFVYYDFSISRSWKSQNSGKEGYSQNFFPDNQSQLTHCVSEPSVWIADKMANAETVTLNGV